VYNRQGQKVAKIRTDWDWPDQIDKSFVDLKIAQSGHQPSTIRNKVQISCWAIRERSVYMAADGHVYPCCWTGFNPSEFASPGLTLWNKELNKYVKHNHAPTVGIEAALDWFDDLSNAWDSNNQPGVCQFFCTHNDNTNTTSGS
jgi:hypothetical protein